MEQNFPVIKISGTPEERGRQHGRQLKDRIHRTVEFYKKQFLIPEQEIMGISEMFRNNTRAFRQDLFEEIEALARAAEVDPLWIYALNGRTELLNLNPMECTTLAFRKQKLMAQNWDWDMEMEELAVILDIETDTGTRILTMTEPGMIAKIGMNSHGVGVCLNFMSIENYTPEGIPLHVLLRAILESKDLGTARSVITSHCLGKVCNLLIADKSGEMENIEIAGNEFFTLPVGDRFVHTNHFLTKVDYDLKLFPNSTGRFRRASELMDAVSDPSISAMKEILIDRGDETAPICRKRFSHPWLTDDTSITVTTLIMDFKNLDFHITRGNPFDNPFSVFALRSEGVSPPDVPDP
jgi:isopenicillin-N N-acyltransferase-like protein